MNRNKQNKKSSKVGYVVVGIIALIIGAVYLTSINTHKWQGFFFPAGCETNTPECIIIRIASPVYGSQNRCMAWGIEQMKNHTDPKDSFNCEQDCAVVLGEVKCRSIVKNTRGINIPEGAILEE